MATVNASAVMVSTPVLSLASSDRLASRRSVAFNNTVGLRSMPCIRSQSVHFQPIRAIKDPKLDGESSTGNITDKAKQVAEDTAATLDGVKEDVEAKLKDGGRNLRSKEGDVEYASTRNAQDVGNKAQETWNEVQSKFTKEQ